ncbi:UvrD-helicase domain-containing protein [Bifidobacterium sp. 82T10]|uniref:DNA 3'-5' helicase n=1 Tax=Bifidobacterium miconis TaxID=2834435 RepID=A0ABS6WBR9_9BIFI|nr:UvrD-helicase domain-containing protein [Bifidobacterium miconis]MBW3091488.1 UvrD-helicase domain-containing protein [Bifidobacterium miconis]
MTHDNRYFINASAGTGKTTRLLQDVMIDLFNRSRSDEHASIRNSLIITFTVAAAAELRSKLDRNLAFAVRYARTHERLMSGQPVDDDAAEHDVDFYIGGDDGELASSIRSSSESAAFAARVFSKAQDELPSTHISSIDALNKYIVDRNASELGIDPGYRILADTAMAAQLRNGILDELFEQWYDPNWHSEPVNLNGTPVTVGNAEFVDLLDNLNGPASDDRLGREILSLYDRAQSKPAGLVWLDSLSEPYRTQFSATKPLRGANWMVDRAFDEWRDGLGPLRQQAASTLHDIGASCGDARDGERLIADSRVFSALFASFDAIVDAYEHGGWNDVKAALQGPYDAVGQFNLTKQGVPSKQLSASKFAAVSDLFKQVQPGTDSNLTATNLVKTVRGYADKLTNPVFAYTAEQTDALDEVARRRIDTLVVLVKLFAARYDSEKRASALAEFADITHLADRALHDPAVRLRLRDQWTYLYVDECQDNNAIQNEIIDLLSDPIGGKPDAKVTMVGDVKQSIYAFRYAQPDEFRRKSDEVLERDAALHRTGDERHYRVLEENHRSVPEILIFVNTVFDRLMRRNMGGVDYVRRTDGGEYASNDRFVIAGPQTGDDGQSKAYDAGAVELLIRTKTDPEENRRPLDDTDIPRDSSDQQQIDMVVRRIRALHDEPRPGHDAGYSYGDIAVLARSTKTFPELYDALSAAGIPADVTGVGTYYQTPEVMIALDWLRAIDNALLDAPMVALLRTFGFSDRTLAELRLLDPVNGPAVDAPDSVPADGPDDDDAAAGGAKRGYMRFYDLLRKTADGTFNARKELADECRRFLDRLSDFRAFAEHHPIDELLWRIYTETGWYDYCGALPDGVQRQGNLTRLCEKARTFEATGERGILPFLAAVEHWAESRDRQVNEEASTLATKDAVHVMTIHKAKGLQWKVVILMGAQANPISERTRSAFETIQAPDGDRGIAACDLRDERHQIKVGTFQRDLLVREARRRGIDEQLRLLYVALTRPQEKLIIAGTWTRTLADPDSYVANLNDYCKDARLADDGALDPEYISRNYGDASAQGTYLSWIISSLWAADPVYDSTNETNSFAAFWTAVSANAASDVPPEAGAADDVTSGIAAEHASDMTSEPSASAEDDRQMSWPVALPSGLMDDTVAVASVPGRAFTMHADYEDIEAQPVIDEHADGFDAMTTRPTTDGFLSLDDRRVRRRPATVNASGIRRWLDSLPSDDHDPSDDPDMPSDPSSDSSGDDDTGDGGEAMGGTGATATNMDDASARRLAFASYPLPDFMMDADASPSPAELGVAVHNVLELFDWATPAGATACADELHAVIERLADKEIISRAVADRIGRGRLFDGMLWFVAGGADADPTAGDNGIFGRGGIRGHRVRLLREEPFSLLVSADELRALIGESGESGSDDAPADVVPDTAVQDVADDRIIVRGVIDGYYVDDEAKRIVLFDYKTDAVRDDERADGKAGLERWKQRLHDDYYGQQSLYAEALRRLYPGYSVAERWLIGLAGQRLIDVSDDGSDDLAGTVSGLGEPNVASDGDAVARDRDTPDADCPVMKGVPETPGRDGQGIRTDVGKPDTQASILERISDMATTNDNIDITGNDEAQDGVMIRFDSPARQTVGGITKITGLVRAKYLIGIIDNLNLQANPRNAKTGQVTSAIQDSIEHDPMLFPFKTKGLLLAASTYKELERNRFLLTFDEPDVEGILDGGHNTLAIGLLILRHAMEHAGLKMPRGAKTWADFKQLWWDNRSLISDYQEAVKQDLAVFNDPNSPNGELSFYVPVELLVPADPDDELCVGDFRTNLLEICEARNNNVELTASTKANQKGYFDDLAKLLVEENLPVAQRVEWKSNDGGDVKVQDIIALSWIVLRLLTPVKDDDGKPVEAPAPAKLYSGKGGCLDLFVRFMGSPEVTASSSADYRAEIRNVRVHKALALAVQLPALYDVIYERFPKLYNEANGKYGRIAAVKNLNKPTKSGLVKTTPFAGNPVDTASPEGFIMPLVYGLTALVNPDTMEWRVDPNEFLDQWLPKIVKNYVQVFSACNYDPQKVGKEALSYTTAETAYRMALVGMLS